MLHDGGFSCVGSWTNNEPRGKEPIKGHDALYRCCFCRQQVGYCKLYIRNCLINVLLEMVDLKHTSDGNKELRQSQTEKGKDDFENIKSLLWSTLNPFNCTTDK